MQVQESLDFLEFLEERGVSPFEYQRLSRDMQQYFVEAWHIECAIIENGQRLPGQPLRALTPHSVPPPAATRELSLRELACMTVSVCFVVSVFSLLLAGGPKQRIESSERIPNATTSAVTKKTAIQKRATKQLKKTSEAFPLGLRGTRFTNRA